MTRTATLLFALFLCLLSANAQASLGFEGEKHAGVGIYIKELSTGKVIAQNDANRCLTPASITKCITAAAALTKLGRAYQFETPVYLYGTPDSVTGSQWNGNLIIESCGDPSIDSDLFKERTSFAQEIISGLKKAGITHISGRIIVSETMEQQGWIPQWGIDDVPWPYGAGLFGFNYLDNTYRLWPATGQTRPHVPGLNLSVIQTEKKNDLSRGIDSENLVVYTPDPNNLKWSVQVSMNSPSRVFAYELATKMKAAGITLEEEMVDDESNRLLIANHESPLLADILQQMMYQSHNLFAEGMLRALAPDGNLEEALTQERNVLQSIGVNTRFNKLYDGSGLARATHFQPAFLSSILEAMATSRNGDSYVALFPVAGKNGTVKSLMKKTSLEGKLALKSGSMGGVQCFAGYKIDSAGKPTHTVVIMVNNFFCSRGELRGAIEKFLVKTFQ